MDKIIWKGKEKSVVGRASRENKIKKLDGCFLVYFSISKEIRVLRTSGTPIGLALTKLSKLCLICSAIWLRLKAPASVWAWGDGLVTAPGAIAVFPPFPIPSLNLHSNKCNTRCQVCITKDRYFMLKRWKYSLVICNRQRLRNYCDIRTWVVETTKPLEVEHYQMHLLKIFQGGDQSFRPWWVWEARACCSSFVWSPLRWAADLGGVAHCHWLKRFVRISFTQI